MRFRWVISGARIRKYKSITIIYVRLSIFNRQVFSKRSRLWGGLGNRGVPALFVWSICIPHFGTTENPAPDGIGLIKALDHTCVWSGNNTHIVRTAQKTNANPNIDLSNAYVPTLILPLSCTKLFEEAHNRRDKIATQRRPE